MIDLKPGDIFCTANPMLLGRIICAIEGIWDKDGRAEYSHSGVILSSKGKTFEALWTNRIQNLFEAYKGKRVLIGRHDKMGMLNALKGWWGVKHHLGQWYAGHRLLLHLIPAFARINLFGLGVCSELTMKYLCKAGIEESWSGWSPNDVANMIRYHKGWNIVSEGVLGDKNA